MKTLLISVALLGGVMLSGVSAEETIVREETVRTPGPGVTVGVPGVGVHIGAPDRVEKRTTTETVGSSVDCESKTVRRDGIEGSTTVRKERCD